MRFLHRKAGLRGKVRSDKIRHLEKRCLICLSVLGSHLVAELDAEVEGTRGRGAVDVAGVAVRALVEVILEGVEEVLHAGVELKLDIVVELEVV